MIPDGYISAPVATVFVLLIALQFVTIIILSMIIIRLKRSVSQSMLAPGECECGHPRCSHIYGTRACVVTCINGELGARCACQIYIPARKAAPDNPLKNDAEIKRLRKMAGL